MSRDTLARIDIQALEHNLRIVRELAPHSRVVSVVKADAYGHGTARVLQGLDDSDVLAVATVGELRDLREQGWTGRLLLLEGFSDEGEFEMVRSLGAEFVVHRPGQLAMMEAAAVSMEGPIWLKIDTGMHRLGFPSKQTDELFQRILQISGGRPPIVMSHFARADEPDCELTAQQLNRFREATGNLDTPVSLANSAAVLTCPESHADYVRPGVMLYGISPFAGHTGGDHNLKPAMTLSCRLLAINTVPAGETVGYGGRFTCPETMRVGVAGIGYGDGYPRSLPDGAPVLVRGRRAPLAGRVSMDMITVDLREFDDVQVGDEVVLWGEGLPVEEVAEAAGMIPYELVCGVTGRVKRKTL